MRHSLLATCLLLTAWTDPAGSITKSDLAANASAFSVVEKTTDGRAVGENDDPVVGPAETTKQLIKFDDVTVSAPAAKPQYISGDALSALDAVADGFQFAPPQPVPLPPHRAIPHTEVCEALATAALNNDVPTPFLIRLIWQESGFRQNVVSPAGAQGVAQFMPATAAEWGLDDPFNPLQAVRASARFLRDLIQQFGNVGLAAAAYNAGPRRVQEWLDKRGKLPQETQNYVERITGKKADEWKGKRLAAPIRVPPRAPCQREAGLYAANGPTEIPLPPVQVKDEPVKVAKAKLAPVKTATAKAATTKTASAKSASSPKDQARIEAKPETGPSKVAAKAANKSDKAASKGRKVKVADAEARK